MDATLQLFIELAATVMHHLKLWLLYWKSALKLQQKIAMAGHLFILHAVIKHHLKLWLLY
eukprot:13304575-Ditylum_brightwellii.AAC.1